MPVLSSAPPHLGSNPLCFLPSDDEPRARPPLKDVGGNMGVGRPAEFL